MKPQETTNTPKYKHDHFWVGFNEREIFASDPSAPRSASALAAAVGCDPRYVEKLVRDGRLELKIVVAGIDARRKAKFERKKAARARVREARTGACGR